METLSEAKFVKAAKDHSCSFCGLRIPKGDTYIKSTHKYEGDIYDWKAHRHCNEIAYRLNMYDNCDYEGLTQEDFMETIHCEYNDLIVKLLPENNLRKYSDIIQQLHRVNFRDKLAYVITYYKKIDKELIHIRK